MEKIQYTFTFNFTDKIYEIKNKYLNNEITVNFKDLYMGNSFSLMLGCGYIELNIYKNSKKAQWIAGVIQKEKINKQNLIEPNFTKGEVILQSNQEEIFEGDGDWLNQKWAAYYDKDNKLFCVGDYNQESEDIGIEFATNVIAVINSNQLKSIWIKDIII